MSRINNVISMSIVLAILAWVVCLNTAHASEHMKILKCEGARNWKECASITIQGDITKADGEEFINRTKEIKAAIINLSSLGGSFVSGLAIGERVFEKKYQTRIPESTMCESSCANIWIAGSKKTAAAGSVLLFHAPFIEKDPDHTSAIGAVLEGVYLAKLGYSYNQAMEMFGGHGPHNVRAYVVDKDGNQHGISCDTDAHDNPIEGTCKQ